MSVSAALQWQGLMESAHEQLLSQKRAREDILNDFRARRKRARHPDPTSSVWLPYDRLQEINASFAFQPLTEQTATRLEGEVTRQLGDDQIDRKVCIVTDTWVFRASACRVTIEELPLAAMRRVLAPPDWATDAIQAYYDCSEVDIRLKGMLLSVRAIEVEESGDVFVWISRNVLESLQTLGARLLTSDTMDSEPDPPRFAIADCFVAGIFEEVDLATQIERKAVGLVQTCGLVKVVYGGPGNVLQSHLLSWDNRNATIASSVPTVPTARNFLVVFAGPMTPAQELVLSKQHECDGGRALLRRVNPLYCEVKRNRDFIGVADPFSVYCSRLADDSGTVSELVDEARRRQQTVTAAQAEVATVDETTMLQSETPLIDTSSNEEEEARLGRALDAIVGRPTYVARRSTSVLRNNDPFYMERVFPHLLTFGIGGFTRQRRHRYSKRDIVLHYLDLSTNRFAEDPLFKLKMLDYLSMQRVQNGVFMTVKRSPETAMQAMRVSPEQLGAAISARISKRKAAKSGRPVTQQTEVSRDSTSLLKSIYASTAKMWCSNQEREAFQRKVSAMTIMYGEPSLFWTLTPNPDSSLAVAFWAGCDLPTGRPKDLVACTTVHMPSTAAMKRLTAQNTVLQAHYYKLRCKSLVDILFSWDLSVNRPKAEPGLFGFVEALFYALEQQGRLHVHHHGVLWVAGLPRTKGDWDVLLGNEVMRARFEEYCSSLFSAELPDFDLLESIECPDSSCSGELKPPSRSTKIQAPPAEPSASTYCSKLQRLLKGIHGVSCGGRRVGACVDCA